MEEQNIQKPPQEIAAKPKSSLPLPSVLIVLILMSFSGAVGFFLGKTLSTPDNDISPRVPTTPTSIIEPTLAPSPNPTFPPDDRILLTPENIRQYNGETSETRCNEKFNNDDLSVMVNYSNKEKGISLEIPYNPNWGNEKYRINPYDEVTKYNKIDFGYLFIGDACVWARPYSLSFLPARTAEEAISGIKSEHAQPTISPDFDNQFVLWPKKLTINNMTVIKYQPWNAVGWAVSHFEIIGKKYNYQLSAISGDAGKDFKLFESIVSTIKLIE